MGLGFVDCQATNQEIGVAELLAATWAADSGPQQQEHEERRRVVGGNGSKQKAFPLLNH